MHATPGPAANGWPNRPVHSAALSTVVYRSQAVREMSPPALHELTVGSQRRNARDAITGLMLYDGGQFFQWIEGPPDNIDRLMGSICQDPRHTGIEILNNQTVTARTFGDWSMKLAAHTPSANPWRQDVIEPPRDIVEGLRKRPEAAPSLLTQLVHVAARPADSSGLDATRQMRLPRSTAEALKSVILSIVLPELCTNVLPSQIRQASLRAADLAELLIGSEDRAAMELIGELRGDAAQPGMLYTTLLEPAARRLGDLWSEDVCSAFDLTLGLCRLQTAVRLLTAGEVGSHDDGQVAPAVLIVPEPGELHLLGSALDTSVLNGAGWAPESAYPRDDRALQELVSSSWYDVLDLSLSVALRRDHWLPRVTETIAQARRASQNPALVVVVGGRVFHERAAAGRQVGANLTSKTAGNVDRSIRETMGHTLTATASYEASPEVLATPS